MSQAQTEYWPRLTDTELARALDTNGAALIEGPKACGKTATALQVARTTYRLDVDPQARALVDAAPEILFSSTPPVLLDEWQEFPAVWNLTRRAVDDRPGQTGLYILTGSSTPNDEVRRHSGAGRISVITQRTMSLAETHHSSGAVSLRDALHGEFSPQQANPMTVPEMVERIVVGGWPLLLGASEDRASRYLQDYLANTAHIDAPTLLGPRRSPETTHATMQSIARNTATEVAQIEIARDVGVDRDTVAVYLNALHRLRLVEEQPAWRTHLRSKATLRSSPKQHFVDPSLAAAALGASSDTLLHDLNTTGFLFESLVIRDLRIYAQAADATVFHYRDSSGREADAIVQDRAGRWCAVEVKLGQGSIDAAAANLLKFAEMIDTGKVGEPSALIVVTVGDVAYRRPDGVLVVPLNAFGP